VITSALKNCIANGFVESFKNVEEIEAVEKMILEMKDDQLALLNNELSLEKQKQKWDKFDRVHHLLLQMEKIGVHFSV
jgi:hypothetical protein